MQTAPTFTVDTHLFRELGELLVGRDSTALVELIKNSYDADATEITVYGQGLSDRETGYITITDNGIGMNPEDFESGFLRIASRWKEQGHRQSRKFGRRYTGAKGIGRLAAHKLARLLEVSSMPFRTGGGPRMHIDATIDWDRIEAFQTLADIDDPEAIRVLASDADSESPSHTTIGLRRLRRAWTPGERLRFIVEVQTFSPPSALVQLPRNVVDSPLLFDYPKVRDSRTADPGVSISLLGDFAPSEDYWDVIAESAQWLLEIDANAGEVHYNVIPTRDLKKEHPDASPSRLKIRHPAPEAGPFFQARILVREGQLHGSAGLKGWASAASGVKVFMEGFRVLPYGEARNDWLSLDLDYTGRSRKFAWLEDKEGGSTEDRDAALLGLPNRSYFGAIFLTQSGAPTLRMLINREGFIPDSAFDTLVGLVRTGIDLTTRSRAAAKFASRQQRKVERGSPEGPSKSTEKTPGLGSTVETARVLASQARQFLADGRVKDADERISRVLAAVEAASGEAEDMMNEAGLIRVLASVGTQMAAFIHEINALLRIAESVEGALERLRDEKDLPSKTRRALSSLLRTVGDLRRRLERQASYLVDVVTPDARRRRSRQSLAERLDAGSRLVQHLIDDRNITLSNDIPPDLKSPPMFPAELSTVFSNLLTNAVKAAGIGGKIRASGRAKNDQSLSVVIENTGTAVNLRDAERWFKPFESTTTSVDPVLGQGMGLGLPITRKMLEQYGADIRFAKPSHGFATAIEIVFPNS